MRRNLAASLVIATLLAACHHEPLVITRNLLAEEPTRFVCEGPQRDADGNVVRPDLPEGYTIHWADVQTVEQAHAEHNAYVARMVERNGVVAGYVVQLEDQLFTCWSNMMWQRDVYEGIPD